MEKLFYRLFLASVIAMSLFFTSCGDDEPDEPEIPGISQPPDTPNHPDTPETPDQPGPTIRQNKVLLSATVRERSSSGWTTEQMEFHSPEYSVNRYNKYTILESYSSGDTSPYSEFSYNLPTKVRLIPLGDERLYRDYTLGDYLNHLLIKEYQSVGSPKHTFEYDTKRRVKSCYVEEKNSKSTYEYTFDNTFNMIGCRRIIDGEIFYKSEISYTTIPAKTIPLQLLDVSSSDIFLLAEVDWPLMEAGFYGNSIPLYLVDSVIFTYNSGEEVEFTYDYELDKDGYVTSMECRKYTNTGTSIDKWTFTWQSVTTPSYTNWLFGDEGSPYYRYLYGS